ncbi:MAG: hypothetical protein KGL71_12190, partial [Xanthomonadaceae bacterium]|nr:hypothetical protein [Xanthomonadaceae bacterium]
MKTQFATLTLAVLGGLGAMVVPSVSQAGNVGTYGSCWGGSKSQAITAAGHTPVAVATLDAASLNGLSGLILESCGGSLSSQINADVTSAVNNGMLLVIDDWGPNGSTSAALPGTPALTWVYDPGSQIDLVAGMPFITGPGGTLTNTSLDGGNS